MNKNQPKKGFFEEETIASFVRVKNDMKNVRLALNNQSGTEYALRRQVDQVQRNLQSLENQYSNLFSALKQMQKNVVNLGPKTQIQTRTIKVPIQVPVAYDQRRQKRAWLLKRLRDNSPSTFLDVQEIPRSIEKIKIKATKIRKTNKRTSSKKARQRF